MSKTLVGDVFKLTPKSFGTIKIRLLGFLRRTNPIHDKCVLEALDDRIKEIYYQKKG